MRYRERMSPAPSNPIAYTNGAGSMDTIIFSLIFVTLLSMFGGKRGLIVLLFFVSFAMTMTLFKMHVSSALNLHF